MFKRLKNRLLPAALASVLLTSIALGPWFSHSVLADSTNLMANPSVETLQGSTPLNWTPNDWGTDSTTLSVTSDAHTGNNALQVITTARTDGDAKWVPDAVAVTAGQKYTYQDYSKATVPTQLDAAYIDASGAVSYVYLGAVAASSDWQANSVTFTVPTGEQQVQILHILATAGSLTTDDFSLASEQAVVTPPPTGNNLIANPSMETASGNTPAGWQSDSWGTNSASFSYVTNDAHTGTASAEIQMSNYTDGDAKWYFTPVAVQPGTTYSFSDYYKATTTTHVIARFDDGTGKYSYSEIATPAAASSWTQASGTFTTPATTKYVTVLHVLSANGTLQTDDASLSVATQTAPLSVSITAPQAGATLSGTTTLSATPSTTSGLASIQFQLDGTNLGSPVTAAPYQYNWDTTTVSDGTHTLTAVATPTSGTPVTSAAITISVMNNTTPPSGNAIANPSMETANPANAKLPLNWQHSSWGTNSAAYSYLSTGHTGSHSAKVQINSYTSGAAYWYPAAARVAGGQMYDFTDYYKANIPSEVDASIIMADGSEQDVYLGSAFASPNSWTKFELQFMVPAGAKSIVIFHDIYSVGYLTTDDFSLTPFSYQGFNRALVSITDDDGFASLYTNGLPVLQKYGLPSTAYAISSYIGTAKYMTATQLKSLAAAGVEIGSHSVDHADLSTQSPTAQDSELKNSQTTLQKLLGKPVTDYAAPYGAYNQQIVTDAKKYYQSYRGVQAGYNARNNFDAMNLQVQNIVSTTTVAQVQSWLQEAAATNTWLILVYHEIDTNPTDATYNTTPTDFDAQMAAVKNSGLTVSTVSQALAELKPQL